MEYTVARTVSHGKATVGFAQQSGQNNGGAQGSAIVPFWEWLERQLQRHLNLSRTADGVGDYTEAGRATIETTSDSSLP